MKYFVMESAVVDNAQANALWVYDEYNPARMVFHQIRAGQLANTHATYAIAMIIDSEGRVLDREYHGNIDYREPDPSQTEPTEPTEGD